MIRFVRDRLLPSKFIQLFIQTGMKWQRDKCAAWGAALAYHAMFSLFPILLVVLSILGHLVGPDTDIFVQVQTVVSQFLPPAALVIVERTMRAMNRTSTGAGLIGFGLLMYSASTVFSVMNQAVDVIWRTSTETSPSIRLRRTVLDYVLNRIVGFFLVLSTAFLLLVSMIANLVVDSLVEMIDTVQSQLIWVEIDKILIADGLQAGSSVLILAIATLVLLKVLPSTRIAWRDLWPGSLLTAALLVLLQRLVSNSIVTIGSRYASYGVVGGVMILLLWIYFTCQIFFIGCEFSYIYAHIFGSRRHQPIADASGEPDALTAPQPGSSRRTG